MNELKNYLNLFKCLFNKFFYSIFFPFFLAFFVYLIYLNEKINIIFLIIVYVLIITCWTLKLIFIPNNKSKKYGIVFLIKNGELYNENICSMFKKIQFELQDNFKIFVFCDNFIMKLDDHEKSKKIFMKKNYHMIINLFSMSAKENSENLCSLISKDITFLSPVQNLDEKIIENLQKDFSFGFKKIVKLSEKNSYIDINQNADLMVLSIRYFVSIIYMIFNQIELAEEQLNLMNFNVDGNEKIVQYLRKNAVKRYAEIYYAKIIKKLSTYEYLYNETELNEIDKLTQKFNIFIGSNPSLSNFRYFMNDIEAKIYFAKGDYSNSLYSLIRMKKKNTNYYGILLSIAFIEINQGNIKGFDTYKKIFKKMSVSKSAIEECMRFINNALKNDIHNEGLLLLSNGILTYYWINQTEGKEIIYNSLSKIKNQEIINYIKTRFEKD